MTPLLSYEPPPPAPTMVKLTCVPTMAASADSETLTVEVTTDTHWPMHSPLLLQVLPVPQPVPAATLVCTQPAAWPQLSMVHGLLSSQMSSAPEEQAPAAHTSPRHLCRRFHPLRPAWRLHRPDRPEHSRCRLVLRRPQRTHRAELRHDNRKAPLQRENAPVLCSCATSQRSWTAPFWVAKAIVTLGGKVRRTGVAAWRRSARAPDANRPGAWNCRGDPNAHRLDPCH